MKAILTIKKGDKDPKNFTREIELTMQECEYLKVAARTINEKGGEDFISIYVSKL